MGSADPSPASHSSRVVVTWIFALSGAEGLAALFAIMRHASEPASRVLGPYSLERIGLITLMAALSLICAAATGASVRGRPWITRVAAAVLGREQAIPQALAGGLALVFGLTAALSVLSPGLILKANEAVLELSLPLLLWILVFLGQLLLVWLWSFHPQWLRRPLWAEDAAALAIVTGLALAVRLPLVTYGLPYEAAWDEVVTYPRAFQALSLSAGEITPGPVPGYGNAGYGDVLITLTKAASVVGLFDSLRTQTVSSVAEYVAPPQGVPTVLQGVHPSGNPLLYPRLLFAILNAMAPMAIYLILRVHPGVPRWAALGGALPYAALNYQVAYYSSFIYPDALAATLVLFSLLFALHGMQDGGRGWHLWIASGLLAGLAASTSMRSILLPLLPISALMLSRHRARLWSTATILGSGLAAGYVLGSPSLISDLPSFLSRAGGLVWSQDASLAHRAESLVFYFRSMFAGAPEGFGLVVLAACVIGIYRSSLKSPRTLAVVALFAAAHLCLVTPIIERYPRHILVLLPFVSMWAGWGLAQVVDWLVLALPRPRVQTLVPAAVLTGFVLLSAGQIRGTARALQALRAFVPSQTQAALYLQGLINAQDIVGLQQELPFVEEDLVDRRIPYMRVASDETIVSLRRHGITLVVGTERLHNQYSLPPGGLWEGKFSESSSRLAEFGVDDLRYEGWPSANLFLFVARVPESSAVQSP